jgi:alkanesulfonate monooxygenase SsuD/methylene tetrahydromethanopterin reductase-like flavin-dependent oxidoreductase (luciferase family)
VTVRFGVILPIQLKDTSLDAHFEELREEVAVAEEAGFDAVFLPEFHQARGGALVSPLLVGAALLQGTTRIRFGSAVLATPLHHPVRLAEDAIMFDWITRGRLILGLGIAHQVPDFKAYGVPRDERIEVFEEVLDIMDHCFDGEPYSYKGKHFTSEGQITPRPYTLPRPEIWVGAHSQSGLERAARRGDLWLADPQRDVQTIAKLATTYRRHAEDLGKTPRVGIFREAWIGDSKADCERVWAANPMQVHRLYYNVGTYKKRFEPWVDEVVEREHFTLDRLAPGRFLYGSPEDVRAEVDEWRALTGCEYLALRFRHPGGPSHAETMEALRRFGAEVIAPLESDTTTGARP